MAVGIRKDLESAVGVGHCACEIGGVAIEHHVDEVQRGLILADHLPGDLAAHGRKDGRDGHADGKGLFHICISLVVDFLVQNYA